MSQYFQETAACTALSPFKARKKAKAKIENRLWLAQQITKNKILIDLEHQLIILGYTQVLLLIIQTSFPRKA